jgi:hypothetical protein
MLGSAVAPRLTLFLQVGLLVLHSVASQQQQQPTCAITEGFDFTGNDLLCANGRPCPKPGCANAGVCCSMCAKKPYYEEPVGLCSAWSWNKGSKTCWMKTRNSSHPSHNGDTSGVVTSRGGRSINASCDALPRAERIACPDVTSGGGLGAVQCAALGCCFDASSDDAAGTAAPQCFYYGEPKGTPPPCSLNGARNAAGGCACDPGWEGVNCERLRLKSANLSDGFNSWSTTEAGTSSWGATQLKGEDGTYHTWVDEMSEGCGINGYENNMQIVHYTSKQRLSGWSRQAPVSNVTSICAHALRDPASSKCYPMHAANTSELPVHFDNI